MPASALIKGGIRLVSVLGVEKVVVDIIRNNTVVLTTLDKVLINTGGFVLGLMIGDQTSKYVNNAIDQVENGFSVKIEKKDDKKPPVTE